MVVPSASEADLPVIDIAALYDDNSDGKAGVSQAMRKACLETGFFYVTGHHISTQPLFHVVRQLFDLPLEEKLKLDARLSPLHRGYTGLGGSHNCVPEESCVVGPDNKESYLLGAEGSRSPMHGDNTWPDIPGWQQQIQQYFSEMLQLSRVVAQGLALSLGLPESFFTDKMQDPVAQLLLLRYPPPPPAAQQQQQSGTDAGVAGSTAMNGAVSQDTSSTGGGGSGAGAGGFVGCGAHTDCGFLTILAQDDVPGLQVKIKDKWVIAPAIPEAFLVNLGDMTQRWTSDLYKSTEHRVFNSSSHTRYSAPFFCNCDFDAVVEPAVLDAAAGMAGVAVADGAGAAPAAKYAPIKAGHYIMQSLGLMWDEGKAA